MRIVDVVREVAAARGATAGAGGSRLGVQPRRARAGRAEGELASAPAGGDSAAAAAAGWRGAGRGGDPGHPSPGPVEENVGALELVLTDDDLSRLEPLGELVVGARY